MKAPRLNKNDKIGVITPSNSITEQLMPQFNQGVAYLKNLGFEIVIGKHALANTLGYSAKPEEKADDINAMFKDSSIRAIICSQGGDTANTCLPLLDFENIKKNPKIMVGISDITVLLNAIYARTGVITFHGNDLVWGFGRETRPYDRQEFIDRFIHGKIGLISSNGTRTTIRGGKATGRLLGGNLRCLLKLAGTPYFPDFADSVLFLESFGFSPELCFCYCMQLEQLGVFYKVKGIVIGHICNEAAENRTVQMADVVERVTAKYGLPILKVNDFGHNCANTVLPVGVKVGLNADEKTIEILEECLESLK